MPEEEEVEEGQVAGEARGLPTPTISAESEPAGSAAPRVDANALAEKVLERLVPTLDELVDRRFKSAKDKRLAKVDEILEWVKEAGGDTAKISGKLAESELLARLDNLERTIASGARGGATDEDKLRSEAQRILEEAGVARDSGIVEEWVSREFTSNRDALAALEKLTVKYVRKSAATTAAVVGQTSAAPPVAGDIDAITKELNDIMDGKYGPLANNPELNKRRKELAARLRELEPLPTQTSAGSTATVRVG